MLNSKLKHRICQEIKPQQLTGILQPQEPITNTKKKNILALKEKVMLSMMKAEMVDREQEAEIENLVLTVAQQEKVKEKEADLKLQEENTEIIMKIKKRESEIS